MAANSVVYRAMQPQDRPALLALWEQVFGDGPAYAGPALDVFAGMKHILVAEAAGKPVAMLLAVPCHLGGVSGVYLYALATHPAYRGHGVMGQLMQESDRRAVASGAGFSALIPATQSLYGYYQKHGYQHTLYLRCIENIQPSSGEADKRICVQKPSVEQLDILRAQWLAVPTIAFTGARAECVVQDVADAGAVLAFSGRGYLLARASEGMLYAAELCAAGDADAQALLDTVMVQNGCSASCVTLPASSVLFTGKGKKRPAAVLKVLDSAFSFNEDTYLRFAMDEAFQFDLPAS